VNRTNDSVSSGELLLDAEGVTKRVESLAQAIIQEFGDNLTAIGVVGIQTRGAYLARRIATLLEKKAGSEISVGILDITLYRDDIHAIADQPEVKETDLPFNIDDRPLVLVDDVLYTGRTVRSAMNALIDYGRPQCIRLAVLIDRGHRELPIGADYVGLAIKTDPGDVVDVNLQEIDEEEGVRLRKGERQ
jgi:pyrimidine operon attenuation protein/uracil phosphoribosyltransferase